MWITDLWRRYRNNRIQMAITDANIAALFGVDRSKGKAINESTYYTCLKMLSEAMGKMPIHYYRRTDRGTIRADPTSATYLLETRPNDYMTPTSLWTTVELTVQQKGNAFVWIDRNIEWVPGNGYTMQCNGLYFMDPDYITIWVDDAGLFGTKNNLYYEFREPKTGIDYIFENKDIMHFKTWYSVDGITGEPVQRILKDTVDGGLQSQNVMNNLYRNGLTASMALQYSSDIDDQLATKLEKKFADKLTGPRAAGKVIPIPKGLELTPLTTKLTDAQFFELKKYNALQIAAAFGIKPNQINDYERSSYSNSETQQLDFLVSTMSYRLKAYEDEINCKLLQRSQADAGYFYRFNEKALLRTESKTQMEILAQGVNNAIYKPNEARDILHLPAAEGGDILMCNGNYKPITQISEEGGENGTN